MSTLGLENRPDKEGKFMSKMLGRFLMLMSKGQSHQSLPLLIKLILHHLHIFLLFIIAH
ncbi:hypothetical protein TTE2579 [Caldanaerobacter subterraneus subsp. tengcongensis MB4]|uniref:Uncharacterized protein n=1 Tax=Caldanaerobacter subterraneus subsp. tengcongensis (strain DSM 15242 / JCM 11007 / NBRC 100824 / MB4) TaxID=273068 RepID=Q8R746_CALS4|nr:hypothetical protein TTE2579 [Caldanaerobacter subterraneus subsp. tengcongensis MB4]